ncbi:MAG: hypothetical protein LBD22_04340 [Spirochaetaceae bacterium]|jgi:hypothetical protein|nr:hypothetical protein [Spirochaetaceae bacterium]
MKKRFYALLVAAVFAVFLFGCDNTSSPSSGNNTNKTDTRATELELYNGTVYGEVTANLKVK